MVRTALSKLVAVTKYLILLFFLPFSLLSQNNAFKLKGMAPVCPLYKHYVYTEALGCINGFNLNFETLLKNKKYTADYFRLWLGFQKDEEWLQNYPKFQGKYTFISSVFYTLLKNKKNFSYEFAPGAGSSYGDPNARLYLQQNYDGTRWTFFCTTVVGIRYTLKKIPINFRVSYMPIYNFTINKFYPIVASFSIGYAFKKVEVESPKY